MHCVLRFYLCRQALDLDLEDKCMRAVLDAGVTLVSIGQRDTMLNYHQQMLVIEGGAHIAVGSFVSRSAWTLLTAGLAMVACLIVIVRLSLPRVLHRARR